MARTRHESQSWPHTSQEPDRPVDPKPISITASRSHQVCQQCHLQGTVRVLHTGHSWDTHSPRRALDDHLAVFSFHKKDSGIVSPVTERLALSPCRNKQAPLRCTQCHDPHGQNKRKRLNSCIGCHAPTLSKIREHLKLAQKAAPTAIWPKDPPPMCLTSSSPITTFKNPLDRLSARPSLRPTLNSTPFLKTHESHGMQPSAEELPMYSPVSVALNGRNISSAP